MVNSELINRLLNNLNFYLSELKKKKKVNLKKFLTDYDTQAIIERRLEEAIESCIDIGNHIISDENLRSAKSYKDIFRVLYENKKISRSIYLVMSDLASFRNVLVHEYANLQPRKVHSKLKTSLKTLPVFISEIIKLVRPS